MSRKYSEDEIRKMAVGLLEKNAAADLDGDGDVTSADARLAQRKQAGLSGENSIGLTDGNSGKLQTGAALTAAKPEYEQNPVYAQASEELLNKILSDSDFSYDMNADPVYRYYSRKMNSEGKNAAEDVYGLSSANTGGYGNSYAAAAASAAYNKYLSELNDIVPELEENAYSRYKSSLEADRDNLKLISDAEGEDYSRYRDNVVDYYKNIQNAQNNQDQTIDFAFKAAQNGDYSYLEDLGIDTNTMRKNDAADAALKIAETGDYSALQNIGVDTSALEYAAALERASQAAKYGDYSYLSLLGIDASRLYSEDALEDAAIYAKYGDLSALKALGAQIPEQTQKISVSVQKGASEAYASGGYKALVKYLDRQISYGQINDKGKQQVLSALTGG